MRFALTASVIAAFFSVFYALVFSFIEGSVVLLLASGAMLFSGRVVVTSRSPARGGNFAVASVFAVVVYVAAQRDDLPIPALVYLATLPLVAAYVAGKAWARVWVVAASVAIVAYALRFMFDLATIQVRPTRDQIVVADTAALIGMVIIIWQLARGISDRRARAEAERLTLVAGLHHSRHTENVSELAQRVADEVKKPLTWIADDIEFAITHLAPLAGWAAPAAASKPGPDRPVPSVAGSTPAAGEALSALREAQDGIASIAAVVEKLERRATVHDAPDSAPA